MSSEQTIEQGTTFAPITGIETFYLDSRLAFGYFHRPFLIERPNQQKDGIYANRRCCRRRYCLIYMNPIGVTVRARSGAQFRIAAYPSAPIYYHYSTIYLSVYAGAARLPAICAPPKSARGQLGLYYLWRRQRRWSARQPFEDPTCVIDKDCVRRLVAAAAPLRASFI